ncbi:multicopper oxidase domain-containing protein [Streptomyces bambusae]|uniref:multicopper oxidase family protein n=1 Tax=Streptomyces bambusae TaxID=1550616 RepID=UPI001CFCB217|nr:multicopper oxidase domain-containing protein [Streptomyces bambusae]MCB5164955.1 multicopper oxidase domain-containing protein [Streptomyces bambusae]
MVTRRSVLGATVAAASATLLTGTALTPLLSARNRADPRTLPAAPAGLAAGPLLPPFSVPMPRQRELRPMLRWGNRDIYLMTIRKATAEIFPGRSTDVLTYDGHFPGPVIRARSGRTVVVHQRNTLDMPVAVHLHGANVAPEHDGSPMDTFGPGTARTYVYPNRQSHAALWFHDHAHHMESEHVYRGLSGNYLLTDKLEAALPLPRGEFEVPITLRDARFDETGQLAYAMADPGRTTILANGRPAPFFQVAARKYRFRLLNGANSRFFALRLSDGSTMTQIGSDGGLLERPVNVPSIVLTPGERADVVIDFSRYPVGTQLVLENTLGPGSPDLVGKVLRFDVVRTAADPSSVPEVLRTLPAAADLPAPVVTRDITMQMDEDGRAQPRGFMNGQLYDPERIDITAAHGTSEIWNVTNTNTRIPHNFHMHLVQFRVLERGGKPVGPTEAGLKDTVRVMAGETVKLHVTFNTYRGDYVYHCHMLDHSAMGMMATFRIR